jgi:hypothetical protein
MFMEDCSRLVPYRDRHGSTYFKLATNDDALAKQIISSLDTRHRDRFVDDAMRSFLESTVQLLLLHGKAYFYFDIDQSGEETRIRVIEPIPNYMFSALGWVFQYAPAGDRRWPSDDKPASPKAQVRQIRSDMLMKIRLPASLRRSCKRLMRKLNKLSDLNYPDLDKLWNHPTLENPNPQDGPFDFSEFRRRFDITLFRTIRATGWTARDYSGAEKSDFFACVNRLRFNRFQITLRDSILQQLNSQIGPIFARVFPDFHIEVRPAGLLSHQEIDQLEQQLYSGQISFRELIQRT